MNILITGHKGLIGSHLYERLKDEGHNVYGWDREETEGEQVEIHPDNFDIDLIIHCGANTFIRKTIKDPYLAKENIDFTYRIYEIARETGADVINFSSSRADSEHIKAGNTNPYVVSKVFGERLSEAYKACYDVNTVNIRPETVWGYTNDDRVMMKWIRNALNNQDIVIYGDEEKELSPLYVDNFVNNLLEIIKNKVVNKSEHLLITGEVRKAKDVAEDIIEATNSKSKIVFKEPELTQPQKCLDKGTRIKGDLKSEVSKVINKIKNA